MLKARPWREVKGVGLSVISKIFYVAFSLLLDVQAEPSVKSVVYLFIYYKKTTTAGANERTQAPHMSSPCAASFQAYSVNAFRRRIRDEHSIGPRNPKSIGCSGNNEA